MSTTTRATLTTLSATALAAAITTAPSQAAGEHCRRWRRDQRDR